MKLFWIFSILLSFFIELSAYACNDNFGLDQKKIEFNFTASKKTILLQAKHTFSIKGMTCSKCVKKVSSAIKSIKCVKSVKVDLKTEKAIVTFSNNINEKETVNKITKAIEKIGYKAKIK